MPANDGVRKVEAEISEPVRKVEVALYDGKIGVYCLDRVPKTRKKSRGRARYVAAGKRIVFKTTFSGWIEVRDAKDAICKNKIYVPTGSVEDKLRAVVIPMLELCQDKVFEQQKKEATIEPVDKKDDKKVVVPGSTIKSTDAESSK